MAKWKVLDEETRQRIVREYISGDSVKTLGTRYSMGLHRIRKVLMELGVSIRNQREAAAIRLRSNEDNPSIDYLPTEEQIAADGLKIRKANYVKMKRKTAVPTRTPSGIKVCKRFPSERGRKSNQSR